MAAKRKLADFLKKKMVCTGYKTVMKSNSFFFLKPIQETNKRNSIQEGPKKVLEKLWRKRYTPH